MARQVLFTAEVEIEGDTILIMDAFRGISDEPEGAMTKEDKKAKIKDQWKEKLYYKNDDRKDIIVFPQANLEKCIAFGGKELKIKGNKTLKGVLATGLNIVEFEIPMLFQGKNLKQSDFEKNNWVRQDAVPNGKFGKTNTFRPFLPPGWSLKFTVQVLDASITPNDLETAIETSGYRSGIGVWRPSSGQPGKHGQFHVKSFKRLE